MSHSRLPLCLALLLSSTAASPRQAAAQALPIQQIENLLRESLPAEKRTQFDDLQSASYYWYESRNPANLPAMDEALEKVLPVALQLSPLIKNFTSWEDAQLVKPYHLAGSVLLSKAYTLLYYGRIAEAESAVAMLEKDFPFSMALRPDRSHLWILKALRYHQHAIALYVAMMDDKLSSFDFPAERDAFDGQAALDTIRDQAIMRLTEGNYEAVDYLLRAARKRSWRATNGDWVENHILEAMHPLNYEAHSEAAWDEFHEAIRSWQRVFPKSPGARLAEAAFLCNRAYASLARRQPYADYRKHVEAAAVILDAQPQSSRGWFTLQTRLHIASGKPIYEVSQVVRANMDKFPDHHFPVAKLCCHLASTGEEEVKICAELLHMMAGKGEHERVTESLLMLNRHGCLTEVLPRLDRDEMAGCLSAVAQQRSSSLLLLNKLALLSLDIGARREARAFVTSLGNQWSRSLWDDRMDILAQLQKPEPKAPQSSNPSVLQALNTPPAPTSPPPPKLQQ